MNTLKQITIIIEFVTVQVIPFADLIIKSIRKWKANKKSKENVNGENIS